MTESVAAVNIDPRLESLRIRARLRDVVVDAGIPRAIIEQRAGFAAGGLHRILTGRVELKLHHVVAVLEAIGVPVGLFFRQAYSTLPRRRAVRRPLIPDHRDVACVYGFGFESLQQLCERLECCELVLLALAERGVLDEG